MDAETGLPESDRILYPGSAKPARENRYPVQLGLRAENAAKTTTATTKPTTATTKPTTAATEPAEPRPTATTKPAAEPRPTTEPTEPAESAAKPRPATTRATTATGPSAKG